MRYHGSTAVVTTDGGAVHIDRRGSVVKITVGGVSHAPLTESEEATK
jgi:hypothetical protein